MKLRPSNAASSETPAGGLGEAKLRDLVGYQLAQATVVTDEIFERMVGTPLDLRPVDYTILMLIKENPGTSPAQLSDALAVARPNMTLRLDKLEKRSLISRKRNASDGRGQHLHVTKSGSLLGSRATEILLVSERAAFDPLSRAEQLMLAELLHKLACARK